MTTLILGTGAWGTSLACVLAWEDRPVALWGRRPEHVASLGRERRNEKYLPGVTIPQSVRLVTEAARAGKDVDLVVVAVPTQHIRAVLGSLRATLPPGVLYCSVAKGLEAQSRLRPTETIRDVLGGVPVAALAGPSHAEEVARKRPTSLVAAAEEPVLAERVQNRFMTPALRVYTNDDLPGVELCGAVKNVIAIAAGACDGLELGDNAKAALITRGLEEMRRVGTALGAQARTFSGLAGLGDLVVTCGSRFSRNRRVGELVGGGRSLAEAVASLGGIAEGVETARAIVALAERHGVDVPITREVHRVLFEGKDVRQAVEELMLRDPRPEF